MKRRATKKDSNRRRVTNARGPRKSSPADQATLSALDALPQQIAIVNVDGTVAATNRAWRDFALKVLSDTDRVGVRENYVARGPKLKAPHLLAFVDLLCTAAGLPPEGVTMLSHA